MDRWPKFPNTSFRFPFDKKPVL